MLNLNIICSSVFVLMLSLGVQAGVVCKSSHPNFNSEARSFYLKFENLQKAQKLGNCEVRIWTQDVCDEKTHEFLYSGVGVTIGTNPNKAYLFGFEHYDAFSFSFKDDGELILYRDVESFEMHSDHFKTIYHEPGPGRSKYETRMNFDVIANSFTRLEFTGTDPEQNVFEHLICE